LDERRRCDDVDLAPASGNHGICDLEHANALWHSGVPFQLQSLPSPRMPSIVSKLADVLSTVRRPGDFVASGTTEIVAPRLEVDGVGIVALPLLPAQAEQLIAAAERSPYGRGADTLVDIGVRRSWQIGADRVRITGKHWARNLEGILARVAEGLGLDEPIAAQLYKLLIYDQGSFFVSHRDTEKAPGMFATLVVVPKKLAESRANKLACPCPHCSDLSRFLADPERKMWILKAAEAVRGHVKAMIGRAGSDLHVATDRGSRPYRLVCTKNQASYDRRAKQRSQDLADLALLEG